VKRHTTFRVLIVVLLALYPFVVFFGLKFLPPSFFGILLALVLLIRLGIIPASARAAALPAIAVLLIYAVTAAVLGSEQSLLYYPVIVSVLLLVLFAGSLRQEEPFLLRVVRASGMPISEHGPRYLWHLTGVWAVFFAFNGLVAAWTTTQSIETWTLYNGLISYLLAALLMTGEYLFRHYYKRKMSASGN
jgi:uncharacterized membrane protein